MVVREGSAYWRVMTHCMMSAASMCMFSSGYLAVIAAINSVSYPDTTIVTGLSVGVTAVMYRETRRCWRELKEGRPQPRWFTRQRKEQPSWRQPHN